MDEFYCVLRHKDQNSGHRNIITVYYDDLGEAKAAAERLARKESDRFYVMKTVAFVEPTKPPLKWNDGTYVEDPAENRFKEDDIPF